MNSLKKRQSSKVVERHQPCPSCPSSDAYCRYEDGHGYCFSCLKYFPADKDLIDLSTEYTYEYIPIRGLTKNTLKHYDIKTKIDAEGKPVSIGFPYPDGKTKARSLVNKEFRWYDENGNVGGDTSKTGLFGADKFDPGSHKYVAITEGEFDAPSLYQVLGVPTVSVQSAATAHRDCVASRDFLSGFERIYLAFDNDAAGQRAVRDVARLFDYNKVYVVKFGTRKDANEYVDHGEGDVLRNLWNNARRYCPEQVVSTFDEFASVLKEQKKIGVPYPFKTLNDMTYGIRTSEAVLLKAKEKVGKTSIMKQILFSLLKGTNDNVAAIFLEEPKRRLLESVASLELQRPAHLPDSGVTDVDLIEAIQKVVVRDERLHVYSHFGSDDPEILLDTIRFLVTARSCRYVLFDHITMACSGLAGEADERRALEYLATRLEMMVKELDFALIYVSHVNDFGQTRGSHYLTKVADITIDASRDTLAPTELERNTINLTIPFNRFAARTGPAGKLRLNPKTYVLEEVFDETQPANDNAPLSYEGFAAA